MLGVFLADFGDQNQPGVLCAMDDVAAAEGGHGDGAVGDFHRSETQCFGVFHVVAAVVFEQRDFQQGAAGEGQHPMLGQNRQLVLQHLLGEEHRGAEAELPMVHAMAGQFQGVAQAPQAQPGVDDHGDAPGCARLLDAVADQVADDGIPGELRHGPPLPRAGARLVRPSPIRPPRHDDRLAFLFDVELQQAAFEQGRLACRGG